MKMELKCTEIMVVLRAQTPAEGLLERDLEHFRCEINKLAQKFVTVNDFNCVIPGRRYNYDEDYEYCGDFEDGEDLYPIVRGKLRVFMGFSGDEEKNVREAIDKFFHLAYGYGLMEVRGQSSRNWYMQSQEGL